MPRYSSPPPELAVSSLVEEGTVVAGKYRLDRLIGTGAMGSVWAATHVGLSTQVAIKFVSPVFAQSPDARRRFDVEAKASAKLRSRYVVQVYDNGELKDGTPYIAMELLEGRALSTCINERGPLPLGQVGRILTQVGRALSHAHEAGIVHRDVKPENIFLAESMDDEGTVAKVLDFGVAKLTSQSLTGTAAGALVGSPLFMSPEQARGLRSIDHRTDIYSLGATAFTMLTGRAVFDAESVPDLLLQVVDTNNPLPRITDHTSWLPPEIDEWFFQACNRDPGARYQSIKEMVAEFHRAASISTRESSMEVFYGIPRDLGSYAPVSEELVLTPPAEDCPTRPELKRIHISRSGATSQGDATARTRSSTPAAFREAPTLQGYAPRPGSVATTPPQRSNLHAVLWLSMAVSVAAVFAVVMLMRFDDGMPSASGPGEPPAEAPSSSPATPLAPKPTGSDPPPTEAPSPSASAPLAKPSPAVESPDREAPVERGAISPPPKQPSKKATETGFLSVDTTPWSNVTIDGSLVGATPIIGYELPAGTHTVGFSNPETGAKTSIVVHVKPGQKVSRRLGLE